MDDAKFWEWFSNAVAPALSSGSVPSDEVLSSLDARMKERGLAWEIGPNPGGAKEWAFAVSFGGDPDRLSRAAEMVRQAPDLACCRVVLGKQPKEWDGTLELRVRGSWTVFRTGAWLCRLIPQDDRCIVAVCADADFEEDEASWSSAADIAVQSVLGETPYALAVADVVVVDAVGFDAMPGDAFELLELGAKIEPLIAEL